MATVLGLSFFYHDSAAALVQDGEVVAAVAEERLCRAKHTNEFPKLSIEYCLEKAGLRSINDLDAIVFYEKPLVKFLRVIETLIATWPRSLGPFVYSLPNFLKLKLNVRKVITDHYPHYRGEVLFSEHHLSHAASAFFPSPFPDAAILSMDGVGEWETTCIGHGEGSRLKLDHAIFFPHSIGLLYSALTAYLGFRVNDGEWKVMGLAPYGEPRYVHQFRKLVHLRNDGSFALDMRYFSHHWSSRYSFRPRRWAQLFGFAHRDPEEPIEQKHEDLARSGQFVTEEIILGLARRAREVYPSRNLVIAGGVGLNSVANWRIEQEGIYDSVWIQPAAGDDGGALGAALFVSHQIYDDPRRRMEHVYLGPEFSDEEILQFLTEREMPYESLDEEALIARAADCIAAGQVIGWYRGRTEFGPRALGNRSIIADATNPETKNTVNTKIKFREYFRPFAPSVTLEDVHRFFEVEPGTELPFMLKIPKVREEYKARLPAITHEDGSGRVQTVREDINPGYYRLLRAVEARVGVPVVVNTSFNVRGEPIVCSPSDAFNCFAKTGIDTLFLGPFCITEKPSQEVDFAKGYEESDALERQIGSTDRTGEAVEARSSVQADAEAVGGEGAEQVLAFYKTLPFNFYSNATEASLNLIRKNPIKGYPNLHRILEGSEGLRVLDVGCGAGWFVNSCALHYGHQVTGLDFNPMAVRQAVAVSRLMEHPENTDFIVGDVFRAEPPGPFDVVNSLGALHHTKDCHGAIRRAISWLRPGGYLHLGLYHSYSREPFLEHFRKMRQAGQPVEELFAEFRRLEFGATDDVHLYSWFRDQVIHPHETQHSYEEISELLEGEGLRICSTSINKFKELPSKQELIRREKALESKARRALEKGRYVPGFFTVLALKDPEAS